MTDPKEMQIVIFVFSLLIESFNTNMMIKNYGNLEKCTKNFFTMRFKRISLVIIKQTRPFVEPNFLSRQIRNYSSETVTFKNWQT